MYHHQFLIYYKGNRESSIRSKKRSFFKNYFIPEGRVDVFVVGARSPVCFDGTPDGFEGVPDGGALVACDLIE